MKKYANASVWLLVLLSAVLLLAGCTEGPGNEESSTNTDTVGVVESESESGVGEGDETESGSETSGEPQAETTDVEDCEECSFGGWVTTKAPTCKAEGKKQRTCTVCGRIEYATVGVAGHAYGDWLMVRSPSVEREGTEERACSDCGEKESRSIAKLTAIETFADLKVCLENGDSAILLTTDILLTDTIYVTGESTIYVKEDHTLTRSPDFLGDLFVIGEDAEGKNSILSGSAAKLTLRTENGATLTVDGNKDNITEAVFGTVFWLTNSAELNMHDGVVVQNCRKTANVRTMNNDAFTTPDKVGGAVAIVENGVFNMYGGHIKDNEANTKNSTNTPEAEQVEGYENSTWGGAIFNRSNFNMYGGVISGNKAARGAAICNYRSSYFYGGVIENNEASTYGGAIYQPSSQYSAVCFGDMDSEDPTEVAVTVRNNRSQKSGGAVFTAHQSSVLIYGNTLFEGNESVGGNGGAFNMAGELTVQYAQFKNNKASSKGGAIYGYYSEEGLETRTISLNGGLFEGNRAPRGGAVSLGAADGMNNGAVAIVGNVIFRENVAYVVVDEATGEAEYGRGGAVHMTGNSTMTLEGEAQFIDNESENNGGALYLSGGAKAILEGEDAEHPVVFEGNTALGNGGAIYLYTDTTFEATNLSVIGNTANSTSYGGGGVFMSDGSKATFKGTILFDSNLATEKGGALFAGGESDISFTGIDDATFVGNRALNHGGAMFITGAAQLTLAGDVLEDAKTVTVSDEITADVTTTVSFVGNTAGGSGGAIYLYTGTSMTAGNVTLSYNTATANGGALYMSKAEDTDSETNPTAAAILTDVILVNNTATGNGGAAYIYRGSTLTVQNTLTMSGNTAGGNGGAVYCSGASSTITDGAGASATLVFDGNTATGNGGGAYITSGATVDISILTATGNTAAEGGAVALMSTATTFNVGTLTASENSAEKGGALYAEKLTATIGEMTLTDNASTGNGGAMYIYTGAKVNIGTLTATGNTADGKYGGAIYASAKSGETGSTTVIDNVQATGNSAAKGGFLYLTTTGCSVTIKAGSIADNTATDGGASIWVNTKKANLYIEQDVDTPICDAADIEAKDADFAVKDYVA